MIKIEDMTVSKELDVSETSTVRGGAVVCMSEPATGGSWCVSFVEYFQTAALQGGAAGVIAAAAALKV